MSNRRKRKGKKTAKRRRPVDRASPMRVVTKRTSSPKLPFVKYKEGYYAHSRGAWISKDGTQVSASLSQELDSVFRSSSAESQTSGTVRRKVVGKLSKATTRGAESETTDKIYEGVQVRVLRDGPGDTTQTISTKQTSRAAGLSKEFQTKAERVRQAITRRKALEGRKKKE